MRTIEENEAMIIKAIKKIGRSPKGLEPRITALATVMLTLDMANRDIRGLNETFVWELTKYGKRMVPHPAFKIQKDAQEAVSRRMDDLGLTFDMLASENEEDPMLKLIEKAHKAQKENVRATEEEHRQRTRKPNK